MRYDGTVARKISSYSKRCEDQIKAHHFDTHDLITVICFLYTFRQTCNTTGFHEGASRWMFPHYIRKTTGTALTVRLEVPNERDSSDKGFWTSYLAVINHLLRKYATEDIFTEAEATLRRFLQLPHQSSSYYLDALWTKVLRMGLLYYEGHIKSLFIEAVLPIRRQSVRAYCCSNKRA